MKKYTTGFIIGIILVSVLNHYLFSIKTVRILSANDYCVSEGFDKAGQQDIVEVQQIPYGSYQMKRVQCLKDNQSVGWYQYPPKTDLENYFNGDLKKSVTVIIP